MKILVATCGSTHSEIAVQAGYEMARILDGSITILTVIKDPDRRAQAQVILDQAVAQIQRLSLANNGSRCPSIDAKVRLGHPSEEIVTEAGEGGHHLIVVGTWPKRNLLHSLLAPTTERVVMQAPCPVLVAKGRISPIRRLLLCVSGAESPSRTASFVAGMARHSKDRLQITILHVMSQMSVGPNLQEDWQLSASAEELIQGQTPEGHWLKREIEQLERTLAQIQPRIRHGLVIDEVLMEALDSRCDLLVIGAHRRAGWQRYLLDDLTHQIVVRADRPVLVV